MPDGRERSPRSVNCAGYIENECAVRFSGSKIAGNRPAPGVLDDIEVSWKRRRRYPYTTYAKTPATQATSPAKDPAGTIASLAAIRQFWYKARLRSSRRAFNILTMRIFCRQRRKPSSVERRQLYQAHMPPKSLSTCASHFRPCRQLAGLYDQPATGTARRCWQMYRRIQFNRRGIFLRVCVMAASLVRKDRIDSISMAGDCRTLSLVALDRFSHATRRRATRRRATGHQSRHALAERARSCGIDSRRLWHRRQSVLLAAMQADDLRCCALPTPEIDARQQVISGKCSTRCALPPRQKPAIPG